ncbi:MAG: ribonuclease P protein component [Candidatus Xenolissoclinum pacificiensis L6]|uniref:Ribonuclease P protein component n=1 Tax=Candidatus Xenolissoclinum pacificiensis L6 TaxID=1401685 RepID=W2V174_9RICK|nr:MAG: ribonuclease P protein component [Candidatus Xenolissoclinum pacificiensis L6]
MYDFRKLSRRDFQDLKQQGFSVVSRYFVFVHYARLEEGRGIAVIASKRIGNAVMRNYAKRRLRVLFRTVGKDLKQGINYLLVARQRLLYSRYDKVLTEFHRILLQEELLFFSIPE